MELGGAESKKEQLGSWLEEEEEDAGMALGSVSKGMLLRDGDTQREGKLEEELVPGKGESTRRHTYVVLP